MTNPMIEAPESTNNGSTIEMNPETPSVSGEAGGEQSDTNRGNSPASNTPPSPGAPGAPGAPAPSKRPYIPEMDMDGRAVVDEGDADADGEGMNGRVEDTHVRTGVASRTRLQTRGGKPQAPEQERLHLLGAAIAKLQEENVSDVPRVKRKKGRPRNKPKLSYGEEEERKSRRSRRIRAIYISGSYRQVTEESDFGFEYGVNRRGKVKKDTEYLPERLTYSVGREGKYLTRSSFTPPPFTPVERKVSKKRTKKKTPEVAEPAPAHVRKAMENLKESTNPLTVRLVEAVAGGDKLKKKVGGALRYRWRLKSPLWSLPSPQPHLAPDIRTLIDYLLPFHSKCTLLSSTFLWWIPIIFPDQVVEPTTKGKYISLKLSSYRLIVEKARGRGGTRLLSIPLTPEGEEFTKKLVRLSLSLGMPVDAGFPEKWSMKLINSATPKLSEEETRKPKPLPMIPETSTEELWKNLEEQLRNAVDLGTKQDQARAVMAWKWKGKYGGKLANETPPPEVMAALKECEEARPAKKQPSHYKAPSFLWWMWVLHRGTMDTLRVHPGVEEKGPILVSGRSSSLLGTLPENPSRSSKKCGMYSTFFADPAEYPEAMGWLRGRLAAVEGPPALKFVEQEEVEEDGDEEGEETAAEAAEEAAEDLKM